VAYRETARLFRELLRRHQSLHTRPWAQQAVLSAAGAGSAMEDAGAENTWQEDMVMPDASPTKSALFSLR